MDFHKTVNIPCFHETDLWEGARGEPSYFKEGNVCSYAPELNYTDFKQKTLYKVWEKTLFIYV